MKRFVRLSLAILMFFIFKLSIIAQGIVIESSQTPNVEAQINNALSQLSMTPVTSGVLIDRTLPLLKLDNYSASTLQDSVWMHYSDMDLMYRSIYAAKVNGSILTSPENAYVNNFTSYTQSNTVPIVLNAMQYHEFDKNAVKNGTLVIQNNKLYYGSGANPASAYFLKKVFSSSLYNYNVGSSVTFTLPAVNLIGNLSINPSQIYIDADDGLGFRNIGVNGSLVANYNADGLRVVKIKFKDLQGTEAVHYHLVISDGANNFRQQNHSGNRGEPITFDPCTDHPCGDITAADGSATIHYDIQLACGGTDITKLKKPLIILDGIDLEWDNNRANFASIISDVTRGLGFSNSSIFPNADPTNPHTLGQILSENDYDVIFVDYHDHHTAIENNAAAVQALLDFVNGIKAANGSPYKNLMLGISMGGVVGMYALRDMELTNRTHDVEKFFTFDSPIQGANIALFGQGMLNHALELRIPFLGKVKDYDIKQQPSKAKCVALIAINPVLASICDAVLSQHTSISTPIAQIQGTKNVLSSIAAKQMLLYNIEDPSGGVHNTFYAKLENMGRPQNCETIGISNGSNAGSAGLQSIGPSSLVFSLNQQIVNNIDNPIFMIAAKVFPILGFIGAITGGIDFDININAFTAPGVDNVIYDGDIEINYLFGIVSYGSEFKLRPPQNMKSIDTAPGGHIGAGLIGEANTVGALMDNPLNGLVINGADFTFIPTVSALDIRGVGSDFMHPNLLNNDFSTTGFDRISVESSPIFYRRNSNGVNIFNNNASHVTMGLSNISMLLDEAKVINGGLGNSLTNKTFNFGDSKILNSTAPFRPSSTPNVITKSITVSNAGKLWINRNDKIAFINEANPNNALSTEFEVTLTSDICTNSPTTVTVINGGEFFIGHQAVQNIGSLVIPNKTKLLIESGGIVTVDDFSNITVKSGGIVEIKSGGKLVVKGNGMLKINKDAKLIVHQGAIIVLENPMISSYAVSSNGSFIHLEGELNLPDGKILIQGSGYLSFQKHHSIKSETNSVYFEGVNQNLTSYRVDSPIEISAYNLYIKNAGFLLNKNLKIYSKSFNINNSVLKTATYYTIENGTVNANIGGDLVGYYISDSWISNTKLLDVTVKIDGINGVKKSLNLDFVESISKNKSFNIDLKNANTLNVNNCNFSTEMPDPIHNENLEYLSKVGIIFNQVRETNISFSNFSKFKSSFGKPETKPQYSRFAALYNSNLSPNGLAVVMKNSTVIDDCEYGLLSSTQALNVLMDQSTISNCKYGIKMIGNSSAGIVKMLCSSLIENEIGIFGLNITLAIDGVINSQNSNQKPSNNFIVSGKNKHFDIRYTVKNVSEILGRYNFWENKDKYFIKNNDGALNIIQNPTGMGFCEGKNFNQCTSVVPFFPIIVPGIPTSLYGGFCINSTTCKGAPIMSNYWKGYNCLFNGEVENTIDHFRPLAEEAYGELNYGSYVYCDDMLNEARAWVNGFESYNNSSGILFEYDTVNCRLKWDGNISNATYFLQKHIGNVWSNVSNANSPYYINSNNFGEYRLKSIANGCPIYLTEPIYAVCDTTPICIDLINYNFINDSLTVLKSSLPLPRNFNLKIEMYNWEGGDLMYTINIPIQGEQGINFDTLNFEDFYPYELGYLSFWVLSVDCSSCGINCPLDTLEIFWGLVRPTASLEKQIFENKIICYPNPFNDVLTLEFNNSGLDNQSKIIVYDFKGQNIFERTISLNPGRNKYLIEESKHWQSGLYIVEFYNMNKPFRKKVIKAK